MKSDFERLLTIASDPLCATPPLEWSGGPPELLELLRRKNGFLAFESALHVYPLGGDVTPELLNWNAPQGWRAEYPDVDTRVIFFASDLFGAQYGVREAGVVRFEPEEGKTVEHSESISAWAKAVLADPALETGWELGHEWQLRYGALRQGHRLLPRVPFILGGDYTPDNLVSVQADEAMRIWAALARQVSLVSDGTAVSVMWPLSDRPPH